MKYFLIIVSFCFLSSCSEAYQQEYQSYKEYSETGPRNKSWFPDIILQDAKNLKNCSYLSSHIVFGKFDFSDSSPYDSMFTKHKKIASGTLAQKLLKYDSFRPDWFDKFQSLNFKKIEIIEYDNFYIIKEKSKNRILFFTYEDSTSISPKHGKFIR